MGTIENLKERSENTLGTKEKGKKAPPPPPPLPFLA